MPATCSVDAFLETLIKSGLIEAPVLQAYLDLLETEAALPAAPQELADAMVYDGLLSRLQAQQLLQGKYKGFLINHKYKLLELLGVGGMGNVFLCEHVLMRRLVALKVLSLNRVGKGTSAIERFQREARAVAMLKHPNLVQAYDLECNERQHLLVLEYVDGTNLHELVKAHGPLDPFRAAHYIAQAAAGLQHAHEAGWVHRDIKPANLLLDRAGHIKLLDMGLARLFGDTTDNLTKKYDDNNVLGTADFIAPEQATNSHDVDIRADVYGLGATFYYLLTGQPPFPFPTVAQKLLAHQVHQPRPVRERRPEVHEALEAIVATMLAKSPGQRYQTPAEVIAALTPWTETPIAPPPPKEMPQLAPLVASLVQANGGAPPALTPSSLARRRKVAGAVAGPATPRPGAEAGVTVGSGPLRATRTNLDADTDVASAAAAAPAPAAAPLPPPSEPLYEPIALTNGVANMTDGRARALTAAAFAFVVCTFTAAGLAWKLSAGTSRPEDAAPRPEPPAPANKPAPEPAAPKADNGPGFVRLSAVAGDRQTFRTLAQALAQAQSGDRIIVRSPVIEGPVKLAGPEREGIIIEAEPGHNPPIVWRPAAGQAEGEPLFEIRDAASVRLKGPFVFDGQERLTVLARLRGECPAVQLEGVEFRGFRWAAVQLWDCRGDASRPVTMSRLRVVAGQPAVKFGLVLEAGKDGGDAAVRHALVRDCRLEGKLSGAVWTRGEVTDVRIERNRIWQGTTGVQVSRTPSTPLELTVANNTFVDGEHGLFFEKLPGPEVRLTVRNNLFANVKVCAAVEGMRPSASPANGQLGGAGPQVIAEGNYSVGAGSREGYPSVQLKASSNAATLPTDPNNDREFLRYPRSHALANGGAKKAPVGVPPLD